MHEPRSRLRNSQLDSLLDEARGRLATANPESPARVLPPVSEHCAGLHGHPDPKIAAALIGAVKGGLPLGAPNRYEARCGGAIAGRFPAIEQVRFRSSGTEASITALSAARAVTGRTRILGGEPHGDPGGEPPSARPCPLRCDPASPPPGDAP